MNIHKIIPMVYLFCFGTHFSSEAQNDLNKNTNMKNVYIKKDTIELKNRPILFLDNKQVSDSVFKEKLKEQKSLNGHGQRDPKTAIRIYGEKYRYGVFFYDSKK